MVRKLIGPALALAMVMLPAVAITAAPAHAATSTLRQLAEAKSRYFGTALDVSDLNAGSETTVAGTQFDMVTPGNEMKWDTTEPSNGQFNFGPGDQIVSWAKSHNDRVRGHNLVWHSQLPGWVNGLPQNQVQGAMETHITTEATHYKGQVYAWDVVNEPFNEDGSLRQDVFYNAMGSGYIADALRTAHAADPNAKLYLNDYNIEGQNAKSNGMYNLVQSLKSQGVPIDGVGFESHFIEGQNPSDLQANMQRFANLGVDVAVTELDDRIQLPTNSGNLAQQATDYGNVVKACLAVSRCVGISQWGVDDGHSWIPGTFPGYGAATMYDNNDQPKPAYNATVSALGGSSSGGGGGSSGEVHAVGSGKCLDVPNLSTTPGTQLEIWQCNAGTNQMWTPTSSGQLTVYSGSSQLCLTASGGGTSAGTKVVTEPCSGAGQQWTVNSNGTITQSGMCLDVTGASTANGALVELWTCNGHSNQQWTVDGSASSGGTGGTGGTGSLPSSFQWSSSGVLISPKSDASHNLVAVKDANAVYYNGRWYVFASTVNSAGNYSMETLNFTDWSQANNAPQYYLDQSGIGGGYTAAPEIFYFAPQHLWYLVYQTGNASYSTNPDITNPAGWSAPKNFYSGEPSIIQQNIGNGYWVDMSVTCDSANCYLFSSDDNGHLYRSQTSLANFPNGMSQPVIALQDTNPYNLFEASHVYTVAGTNTYLLMVEAIGGSGHRYFRSWTAPSIAGPYTPLAASENSPLAGPSDVTLGGTPWTQDISHGDLIRSTTDQTITINPCKLQFLYQGKDPSAGGNYNSLPWRLGLLTQTNSTC
ncbi:MAG TPA: non-reducing end alpha-L-arabinofuranosidase family hydrolase [Pseudonocardiaceae bacterium]|nr:non-reducing end alpha-L-arabinofuranosidase family hydrolase [Pseudonocardiaceae bacterium]